MASRLSYKPFGEVWSSSGSFPANDRTFTRKRQDAALGLVNFENRYYDPQAGRFISADPRQLEPAPLQAMRLVEWGFQSGSASPADGIPEQVRDWQGRTFEPQDLNRFSYVLNNPLNRVDVDGYGFWKWVKKFVRNLIVSTIMSLAIMASVVLANGLLPGLLPTVFGAIGNLSRGVLDPISRLATNVFSNLRSLNEMATQLWRLPTNMVGHTLGVAGSGEIARADINGIYTYEDNMFGNPATTFGDAVLYQPGTSPIEADTTLGNIGRNIHVYQAEAVHVMQGRLLGPLYLPLHIVSGTISIVIGAVTFLPPHKWWHEYNFMEHLTHNPNAPYGGGADIEMP